MKIQPIETGFFKLDGGAMFGVVPKTLWNKLNPADDRNLCTWAMRCLLIEDSDRLMLVDTGIGKKQDEKFFGHYDVRPGDDSLMHAIQKAGYSAGDITDVLLTHLHFDHVGGAVVREGDRLLPTFVNAVYWTHGKHWKWATEPNPRERASFLRENIIPLHESGQLRFVDEAPAEWTDPELILVDGHTEKMMLPKFRVNGKTVAYMADLIPSAAHVPLPYVMSYDVRPLLTMQEKETVLRQAADESWILVFEHDPTTEAATVEHTDKGVRIRERGRLADFL